MKWYEHIWACLLISAVSFCFAAEAGAVNEVMVSAALSLKAPFEEIGSSFEKKAAVRVVFNFGPSGMLQKQIENGAPVEVFASASPREMDSLESIGLIIAGTRSDFAGNSMVLIAPANSNARLLSFEDLRKKEIARIAIGNPSSVPAGKYSEETLRSLGLWDALKPKLVYGEHVKQVMDYVARGEVDAGMVFMTDAMGRGRELRIVADAPESSHKPVVYTIAAVKGSKNEAAAGRFISHLMSKEGREILRKHGFRVGK